MDTHGIVTHGTVTHGVVTHGIVTHGIVTHGIVLMAQMPVNNAMECTSAAFGFHNYILRSLSTCLCLKLRCSLLRVDDCT